MNIVRLRFEIIAVVLMAGQAEWMRSGYQISLLGKQGWQTVRPN
ncbi:MAG: hypothetical protein M2R45_02484 [Verrucomicrobia subdivision 3 bacterium]|nr:hypothetical protein [Limisphaerales bacterium]MCS1413273.1 hypothetical protein [Limisphaerales bacterium]